MVLVPNARLVRHEAVWTSMVRYFVSNSEYTTAGLEMKAVACIVRIALRRRCVYWNGMPAAQAMAPCQQPERHPNSVELKHVDQPQLSTRSARCALLLIDVLTKVKSNRAFMFLRVHLRLGATPSAIIESPSPK